MNEIPQRASARGYLARLFRSSPRNVVLALVLTLLASVTNGIGLVLLLPLLEVVGVETGQGTASRVSDAMIRALEAFAVPTTLASLLIVYVVVVAVGLTLTRFQTMAVATLNHAFRADLRKSLHRHIAETRWLFFVRQRGSDFSHVITTEVERIGNVTVSLLSLAVTATTAAIYVVVSLVFAPIVTLLVTASGATVLLLMATRTRKEEAMGETISERYKEMYAAVSEHLAGMKVSKSHGALSSQIGSFGRLIDGITGAYLDAIRYRSNTRFLFDLGAVALLGVFVYLMVDVLATPTATLLLLLFLYGRLIPMFSTLQGAYHGVVHDLPAYRRVVELELRCREARERAPEVGTALPPLREAVALERVGFDYRDGGKPVLEDVSMRLEAHRTTAVVGVSGAGKSTLADLVIGLLEPDRGRVTIDGAPLDASTLASWKSRIAYVNQDTFLFNASVEENLRAFQPAASRGDLEAALARSAASFVHDLPDGLDTVLGDRGVRLSGGERQRLALARALLRDPELLVLDEATSALDAESERTVQEAIDALRGQVTILAIAHRFSSIRNADAIHVLEGGRIAESGTWSSLMRRPNGRFRTMVELQLQGRAGDE